MLFREVPWYLANSRDTSKLEVTHNMRLTLLEKIQIIFKRDDDDLFWHFITDEELELKRMDVWQLATVIHDESQQQTLPQKKIVAEHFLQERIARIQSNASLWSALGGAAIAIACVFIADYLALKRAETGRAESETQVSAEKAGNSQKSVIDKPVQKPISSAPSAVSKHGSDSQAKQSGAK
jgi:hypothetical protein